MTITNWVALGVLVAMVVFAIVMIARTESHDAYLGSDESLPFEADDEEDSRPF